MGHGNRTAGRWRVRKDSHCLATTESRRRLASKTFATQQLAKPIARPEGFEPSTPGLEGALSEQMVNIGLEGPLSGKRAYPSGYTVKALDRHQLLRVWPDSPNWPALGEEADNRCEIMSATPLDLALAFRQDLRL